tara:strand:+ start:31149 stop:32555 length:1407 start_codon:yes stop_codon:yes gene_type:complete
MNNVIDTYKKLAALFAAGLIVSACAQTPLPELPASDVPAEYQGVGADAVAWPASDWWRNFESDELMAVIDQVRDRNLVLGNNERNLRLAQLTLRDAGFDLLPTPFVDVGGSSNYSGAEVSGGSYADGGSDSFDLAASFAYTDILSKPGQWDAAKGRFDFSVAQVADVRLNTMGTAASTYFRVLLLRDRIAAAIQNVKNAEAITTIVEARVDAGTVNKIDLLQQRIALQREKNRLSSLQQDEFEARAALALLLAENVADVNVAATTLANVTVPTVAPGLPSELLTRRPDIMQAEANLRVSRANVDLARLAYLPNISITGSAWLVSDSLGQLIDDGDRTVNATASLSQLLLDNGARGRNVERNRLQLESSLADYRETVLSAFNEIEVSLGNIELLDALGRVAGEDLKRAEEAFRIAEVRYREGVDGYQTVLTAQDALFAARDTSLDNKLAQLNAVIAFYQSLGGGWSADQ